MKTKLGIFLIIISAFTLVACSDKTFQGIQEKADYALLDDLMGKQHSKDELKKAASGLFLDSSFTSLGKEELGGGVDIYKYSHKYAGKTDGALLGMKRTKYYYLRIFYIKTNNSVNEDWAYYLDSEGGAESCWFGFICSDEGNTDIKDYDALVKTKSGASIDTWK